VELVLQTTRYYSADMKENLCEQFLDFLEIIRRLRAPDGCPWDKEQTHKSLKSYTIEEAYELVEAIDSGNDILIKEELGDVLLQIALHCQIAAERGSFDFGDVVEKISRKMIYRHPHVFGDKKVFTSKEVEQNWSKLKKKEKNTTSALDGIPDVLPALLAAHRMSERASKVGFDWPDIASIFDKIEEEWQETQEAYEKRDFQETRKELGDLLFAIVNLIRRLNGNAEEVMRQETRKFSRRFREMEKILSETNQTMDNLDIDEMDALWEKVKRQENR